jgi:hypothetical protein
MLHQDFGLGRERMVEMRREVEHNRLESRLAKARLSKDATGLEEAIPRKKSLAARGAAVIVALFR